MRVWFNLVTAVLTAGPSWGQEAGQVTATFSWSSLDLSTVPMAERQEGYALDSVVTISPDTVGPLSGLSGRCIVSGVRDLGDGSYAGSGLCALTDRDGDRLVSRIAEGAGKAGELPTGQGTWDGGTGKFAGVTGEFTYGLVSYGLQPPGSGQGTGRLQGTWVPGR